MTSNRFKGLLRIIRQTAEVVASFMADFSPSHPPLRFDHDKTAQLRPLALHGPYGRLFNSPALSDFYATMPTIYCAVIVMRHILNTGTLVHKGRVLLGMVQELFDFFQKMALIPFERQV
jgi:hypothetical protein